MGNFRMHDVRDLYAQHTTDTGQVFAPDTITHAFTLTQGQPWLVNALAKVVVEDLAPDPTMLVTPAFIDQACEVLIQRQDTHLDSLAERLREPRVRAIIEPILAGTVPADLPVDDVQFVRDLGLVRQDAHAGLVIANPIYAAIIARSLTTTTRALRTTTEDATTPSGRQISVIRA